MNFFLRATEKQIKAFYIVDQLYENSIWKDHFDHRVENSLAVKRQENKDQLVDGLSENHGRGGGKNILVMNFRDIKEPGLIGLVVH